MQRIDYCYYLLVALLAPLIIKIIIFSYKFKLNIKIPGINEPIILIILALLLTFALTRLDDISWDFALAFLWTLSQQRIYDLAHKPLTVIGQFFTKGFDLNLFMKYVLSSNILTISIYIIILVISIKILSLKDQDIIKFVILTIIFYQLGFHFIAYRF